MHEDVYQYSKQSLYNLVQYRIIIYNSLNSYGSVADLFSKCYIHFINNNNNTNTIRARSKILIITQYNTGSS